MDPISCKSALIIIQRNFIPETGVKIAENSKIKEGDKNFLKKFGKYSVEEYKLQLKRKDYLFDQANKELKEKSTINEEPSNHCH